MQVLDYREGRPWSVAAAAFLAGVVFAGCGEAGGAKPNPTASSTQTVDAAKTPAPSAKGAKQTPSNLTAQEKRAQRQKDSGG